MGPFSSTTADKSHRLLGQPTTLIRRFHSGRISAGILVNWNPPPGISSNRRTTRQMGLSAQITILPRNPAGTLSKWFGDL